MFLRTVLLVMATGTILSSPVRAGLDSVAGQPSPASPEQLSTVSPLGDPAQVAVSLANGFPVWYQDENGLKLRLCLDSRLEIAPGVVVNPCEYEPPSLGAPPSFPGNFGAEALYWSAATFGEYVSSDGLTNTALLVLALEAAGANEAALNDGSQAVFSRIRLRIDVPVAGTYRVTHPYGTFDYEVAIPGRRAINQTQDAGLDVAQDFLAAMRDRQIDFSDPDNLPPGFDPAEDDGGGVVNTDGATIGPFLVPANPHDGVFDSGDPASFAGGPITIGDAIYIGLPFAPNPANPTLPIEVFQPVTGSSFIPPDEGEPANYFRIELLDPAAGFQLNPGNPVNPQRVQLDHFLLVGKLFNDAANLIPVSADDRAGAATGSGSNINVIANDLDVTPENVADNAHDLNSQALAVADFNGPVLNANGMPILTAALPTAAGGTVRRVTSIPTGKTTFLYSPPDAGFFGNDSFQYVVQDFGGLVSSPATVEMTVEALQVDRADFRAKVGKWHLRGSSSDSLDNSVTLYSDPRARLTPDQQVQSLPVTSSSRANSSLRVTDDAIEYQVQVDPLPITAVTAVNIHAGAPGTNGPVIFSLFDNIFGTPFASPRNGTLTAVNLQLRPEAGISSFSDAVEAILNGNAYINLLTTAFPAGEIRGQLRLPVIGRAAVAEGVWEFSGRSTAGPGALQNIMVESDNGVRSLGAPLRLR